MQISTLHTSVENILYDYYSNTDTTSSTLIIGGNTISINVSGNTNAVITAEQMTKITAAALIVGKYCMILDYPVSQRPYLAVLMGLSTKSGETPSHYGAAYASNLFDGINIGSVELGTDNKTVSLRSSTFGDMSLASIRSYVQKLLSDYTDNPSDYGYDEIEYADGSSSSSSSSSNSSSASGASGIEIVMPLRLYHALICRYLIKYIQDYGAEKVVYIIIYSIKTAIKLISSSKIVNVSIVNSDNANVSIEQLSNISSVETFGVPELNVNIKPNNKISILICIIVCSLTLVVFGSITIYSVINSVKRVKEINFKYN